MRKVDTIIIGAGPGGYELASSLAAKGETVVIAEKSELGGTCLNRGCIPTKTLCASAAMALEVQRASQLGIDTNGYMVDYPKIHSRVSDVVDSLREGVAARLSKCELIKGTASFVTQRHIRIDDTDYTAERIVVASGSQPSLLDIPGKEYCITSDEALWLDHLPQSVIIIGGGVIGMEIASIYAAFGIQVSVLEYCKEILPAFDSETAKRLRMTLSRRGIEITVNAEVKNVSKSDNHFTVRYEGKKGPNEISAELVIMAVGRKASIPDGFIENGGQINGKGFIVVDESMKTSIPDVYAIGDVNGLSMLAHSAYAQARVIEKNNPSLFDNDSIPSVVFTSPEVAMVGYTSEKAEKTGLSFHVVKRPFASNGKSNAEGLTDGFIKFICKEDNTIIGISIIGHHAADLIAEATFLVNEKVKLEEVSSKLVHVHPTISEIFC